MPKKPTDSVDYLAFMTRVTKNLARRAVDDGVDTLHSLGVIYKLHDQVMHDLVAYLRSEEGGAHTWEAIGDALGVTRSAAQKRFGS